MVKPALWMFLALLCGFLLLGLDTKTAMIGYVLEMPSKLANSVMLRRAMFVAYALSSMVSEYIQAIASSGSMAVAVVLAAASALVLVLVRKRYVAVPMKWPSTLRLGILGFITVLAVICSVDACFIARQRNALMERIVREYPDSFRGRLIQGQQRQRERVGEVFELEFTDAISGRQVSMKDLRGKVVVVDFWATWCGPCTFEMEELKRLYTEYHDKGVEFIGVSHDLSEEDGGLEALKEFVKNRRITWPQYYLAKDNSAIVKGIATNDFSESWGIDAIPAVFIIDAEGNLYSTEARGKLDTLIPRLLQKVRASSSGQ